MQDSAPHLSKYGLCPEQSSWWLVKKCYIPKSIAQNRVKKVQLVKKASALGGWWRIFRSPPPEQGEESPVLWKRPVFWCSGEKALFFHPQGKVKEVQFGEDTVLELMVKNSQLERGKSSWWRASVLGNSKEQSFYECLLFTHFFYNIRNTHCCVVTLLSTREPGSPKSSRKIYH